MLTETFVTVHVFRIGAGDTLLFSLLALFIIILLLGLSKATPFFLFSQTFAMS
jgi:hypothetical protein